MSMRRYDYVIVGYDLSYLRNTLYTEEWACDERNLETWEYNKVKGEIQLFSDSASGHDLYFGYIISAKADDNPETVRSYIGEIERQKKYVDNKLHQAFKKLPREPLPYGLICLTEYR